jgi:hypothetical protein
MCFGFVVVILHKNHRPFNTRNIADREGEVENVFRFRDGMSARIIGHLTPEISVLYPSPESAIAREIR